MVMKVCALSPCAVLQQSEEQQDHQQQQQQRRAAPNHQQLSNLWQQFVDTACLSSSHERKALALQLLQFLLPVMTPDSVPVLLSKQLLGCLGTALRNKDSYLHASAKKCMVRLPAANMTSFKEQVVVDRSCAQVISADHAHDHRSTSVTSHYLKT